MVGRGAPHATTNNDLADSDDGECGYQATNRTPHGDWAGPHGGGSPGNLWVPRRGASCSSTTEDLAESDKCKSIYQSEDGTLCGDCTEPCGGCRYMVAGRGHGGSRPGRGGTPGHAASHSTTNKDSAGSDNSKSRHQSSVKTPHGDAVEPRGVVGMELLLGPAPVGADQGGCLQLAAELRTTPPTKTRCHQLRTMEATTVPAPKVRRMAMTWGQAEMERHCTAQRRRLLEHRPLMPTRMRRTFLRVFGRGLIIFTFSLVLLRGIFQEIGQLT